MIEAEKKRVAILQQFVAAAAKALVEKFRNSGITSQIIRERPNYNHGNPCLNFEGAPVPVYRVAAEPISQFFIEEQRISPPEMADKLYGLLERYTLEKAARVIFPELPTSFPLEPGPIDVSYGGTDIRLKAVLIGVDLSVELIFGVCG